MGSLADRLGADPVALLITRQDQTHEWMLKALQLFRGVTPMGVGCREPNRQKRTSWSCGLPSSPASLLTSYRTKLGRY